MKWSNIHTALETFIEQYKAALLGTLITHALFILILIACEISKPDVSAQSQISVLFEPEIDPVLLEAFQAEQQEGGDENKELKNIEKNLDEKNKSFNDYYREIKEVIGKSTTKELFKAEDYSDKRYLIKDYSKETFTFFNEKPEDERDMGKNDKKNTYAGNTAIEYSLKGRKAVKLPVPAYQCLGGGTVTVEISVNQKGFVVSANLVSGNTGTETCLAQVALKSASLSKFNPDFKSPVIQKGIINYKFIPQ